MDKKRILMIDDEEDFCYLIKTNLEEIGGIEVTTATNAKDGIEIAKKTKPDLILLDIMMPEISGFDALQTLKYDKVTSSIPVIMLTVVESDIARIKAAQLETADYITKPVLFNELYQKVKMILFK